MNLAYQVFRRKKTKALWKGIKKPLDRTSLGTEFLRILRIYRKLSEILDLWFQMKIHILIYLIGFRISNAI